MDLLTTFFTAPETLLVGSEPHVLILVGLGALLGFRHALDADHIVAVSTLASEQRGIARSSLTGTMWGVGHTVSLLCVGGAMILLEIRISEELGALLELLVAGMLIILGMRVLLQIASGSRVHTHFHSHGKQIHTHVHMHNSAERDFHHAHPRFLLPRRIMTTLLNHRGPFIVGLVHGLAGSAGIMLILIPTIQSPEVAIIYLTCFGMGSIASMALMSITLSLPFYVSGNRFARLPEILKGCSGFASILVGLLLAWEITALGIL